MANQKTFTLRVPEDLHHQILQRTLYSRRSRNSEIVYLLERALDTLNEQDEAAITALERHPPRG